jgi:hypothetical protein
MRAMTKRIWFLWTLTLSVLCLGASAWAQDSGGSKPGQYTDAPQVAQPSDGGVNWKGVGLGAGAVVSNLVYVPAKLVYGILGGIAGGAGYALTGGNTQVANSIWRSSLGGDYVLTPDMMTGKEPIYFSGPPETRPVQTTPGTSAAPARVVSTPGASFSQQPVGASTPAPARPIDNGAGPVSAAGSPRSAPYAGNNTPAGGYRSYSTVPALKGSGSSDTSVE